MEQHILKTGRIVIALMTGAMLASPPTHAFDGAAGLGDLSMIVAMIPGNKVLLDVARSSTKKAGHAPQSGNPISKGSAASAALQYRPSPSVSASLRQELAEHMAKANPAQAQNIRQALSSDAMWKEFSRLLSSYGYSGTNVADVMTGYFTAYWEIVNGIDASSNAAGVRAARDRIAAALASNPDFLAMSDADKQRFAESMGYFAVVAAAGMNELMKAGNRTGLAELQKAVHQTMLQTYGVDLKRLKLTSQGFVQG